MSESELRTFALQFINELSSVHFSLNPIDTYKYIRHQKLKRFNTKNYNIHCFRVTKNIRLKLYNLKGIPILQINIFKIQKKKEKHENEKITLKLGTQPT